MAVDWRQTPYGPFAADFAVSRLVDLCDPEAGIQTGPFGSQLHQEDYVQVGTPIITVEHLGENRILHQDVPKVSDSDRDRLSRYLLRQDDIVFSRVGSVDRRALVRGDEDGWMFSGRCLRVRPDPAKVDSGYLSYFFGLPSFKEHVRAIAVGATMPSLNTALLSELPILYPSNTDEQRAIARILGTLDDKIELNRRVNETLEAMVRALFKSWFTDFDPVRAKVEGRNINSSKRFTDVFSSRFVTTEAGQIPEGWELISLGKLAEAYGGLIQTGPFGSQLHAADYVEEGIPVVMPQDISGRRVLMSRIAKIRTSDADRLSKHRIQAGDIVYSRRGDVERHALISRREDGWLCGTGCLLVRLGKDFPSPLYASLALDQADTRAWIVQHAIGATMPNLNTGILSEVPMLRPSEKTLGAFQALAGPVEERILANEDQNETLANLRDALLPKLMSGELRLTEAERTAEVV